jgi:hypothetical protein
MVSFCSGCSAVDSLQGAAEHPAHEERVMLRSPRGRQGRSSRGKVKEGDHKGCEPLAGGPIKKKRASPWPAESFSPVHRIMRPIK